jgi:serine/threonine protein phosphatase PrpC
MFGSRTTSSRIPLKQAEIKEGAIWSAVSSIRVHSSTNNVDEDNFETNREKSKQMIQVPKNEGQLRVNEKTLMGNLQLIDSVSYTYPKRGGIITGRANEDAFLLESRELRDGLKVSLIGVFDGHVNGQLSSWLSSNFGSIFYKVLSILQHAYGLQDCLNYTRRLFPSNESFLVQSKRLYSLGCPDFITLSICTSFAICDELSMSLHTIDTVNSGSCASIVVITNSGIFISTIGDSSVALISVSPPSSDREGRDTYTLFKTSDHRAVCRPDEIDRVTRLGGKVHKGRSVGMEYSSINVTRSLGDTIWRANDDWRRDRTEENAVDEELMEFSRMKGCVGITSEPEWYSCFFRKKRRSSSSMGDMWLDFKSNSPETSLRHQNISCCNGEKFFIIAGSDGFWETNGMSRIIEFIETSDNSSSDQLINIAKTSIGSSPHDDATIIVAQMGLVVDGGRGGTEDDMVSDSDDVSSVGVHSSIESSGVIAPMITSRRRSQSDTYRDSNLDDLFR